MGKNLLCIIPKLDAPFVINLRQPLEVLKGQGALSYTAIKEKDATIHDILGHDAVLFFRSSSPDLLKLLYFAKLSGKPVIFAVDDNFFELAHSEIGAMDPVRLCAHERFIREADNVMVYSNPMLERAGRLNKNAVKMVPGLDFSILEGLERQADRGKTRIVYATWRNKRDILSDLFIPAIKKLLQEYGGQVEMHFWGYVPEELKGMPGVYFMPRMDYDTYLKRLYSGCFNIGLAPLKDDEFHRSKTNTKFRDYGACGIAGVYSDVDVYSDCVNDGETGLIVDNTLEGWYGGMKRLIDNPGLRASIKDKAFKYVREHYGMGRVASDLNEIIDSALRLKIPAVIGAPPNRLFDIKTPRAPYVSSEYKFNNLKPYSLSFRLMRRELKPYRSAISLYLFKKTGLTYMEKAFRENFLKPVKNYARKFYGKGKHSHSGL